MFNFLAPVLGMAGGLFGSMGQNKMISKQNQIIQNAYDPEKIWDRTQQLYPYLGDGPGSDVYKQFMSNPWQLNPQLMNQPFHLSARREPYDMQRGLSAIGRGRAEGGLASAMPFAGAAARTDRDVNTMFNYHNMAEQMANQRFFGAANLTNQAIQQGGMGMAGGLAQQQAKMPWQSILGNAIQGGLQGFSTLGPMNLGGKSQGTLTGGSQPGPVAERPPGQIGSAGPSIFDNYQDIGTPMTTNKLMNNSAPSTPNFQQGIAQNYMQGGTNPWSPK